MTSSYAKPIVWGGKKLEADPFCQDAFHMSQLSDQFQRNVHAPDRDLGAMWFIAKAMRELADALAQAIALQRQTLKRFPTDLLVIIASFNTDPSLRTLGQTCKDWKKQFYAHQYAIQWTASVLDVSKNPRDEKNKCAVTIPLQEFRWLDEMVLLPSHITSRTDSLLFFSDTEGITCPSTRLLHHKSDGEPISVILDDAKIAKRLFSADIQEDSLRLVVDNEDCETVDFMEIKRDAHGSFRSERIVRGKVEGEFEGTHLGTWSPDSFFTLFLRPDDRLELTEYDFMTCSLKCQRDVTHLFNRIPEELGELYIKWYAGMLLLVMKHEIDTRRKHEECEMKLVILDWTTNTMIGTLREMYNPSDGLGNQLFFALQLYGYPLVYLSFGHEVNGNAIHVWNPHTECGLKKRKREENEGKSITRKGR